MKRKVFLIILIGIVGYFAWRLLISLFPSEPIEVIPKNLEQIPEQTDDQTSSEKAPVEEQNNEEETITQNNSQTTEKETSIETTIETSKNSSFITNKKVSWGYSASSGRTIDTIVIHSSYDALGDDPYDLDGLIAEYKQYGVAPHYLIDRKGNVYRLVDDKNIAYHAGVSETPDGRTGVNNFSIGIEMMNTKEDDFTSKQYSALNDLLDYLEGLYSIKYVLGHEDISPDRKTDPWNFDWNEMGSKKSIH